MIDVLSLAIVGAAVSVLVQFLKNMPLPWGTQTPVVAVIALSLCAGGVYVAFGHTVLWQTCLQVMLYANSVYLFVIKPLEDAPSL